MIHLHGPKKSQTKNIKKPVENEKTQCTMSTMKYKFLMKQ